MSKCPFCKNRINRYDGQHIYRCNKNMHIWNKRDVKYEYLSFNFPIISKKNILFDEYVIKTKSLPDIKKEYLISYRNILFLLDYFDIKKRTLKGSSKQISTKKYKKTCLQKYGVDNISKLQSTKDKKNNKKLYIVKDKNKFNELYNMFVSNEINIFNNQIDEQIKKQIKKSYNEYYHYWLNLNDEQKDYMIGKKTLLETRVSMCLDNLNLSYIKKFMIGRKFFDIKINNSQLLIDVNSDFWHVNPIIYKENDKLNFPFRKIRAKMIWYRDKCKQEIAESYGYKLIYIWEFDIKDLNDKDLIKYIIDKLEK